MWKKKAEVIPIIIGATGIVEKNMKKYLNKVSGQHRSAALRTAHILRKVLSIKPE